jgi:hypothetical protein
LGESYTNYYCKLPEKVCIGKVVTEDKLIQFPNHDMKAAYSTLSSNLLADYLAA